MKSLTVEGAIEIVQYHLRRNLIAYEAHRKKADALAKRMKANVSL
jgi:hypothetical protein